MGSPAVAGAGACAAAGPGSEARAVADSDIVQTWKTVIEMLAAGRLGKSLNGMKVQT